MVEEITLGIFDFLSLFLFFTSILLLKSSCDLVVLDELLNFQELLASKALKQNVVFDILDHMRIDS